MSTPHTSPASVARVFVSAINSKEFTALSTLLTPDIEYSILPASVGRPPVVGLDAVVAGFKAMSTMVPDFSITIDDIVETEDKVWIHAQGTGNSIDGREYKNEVVAMMDIVRAEDGGLHVKRVREMMDSHFVISFFGGAA